MTNGSIFLVSDYLGYIEVRFTKHGLVLTLENKSRPTYFCQDLSHFSLTDVPAEIFNFERTLESLNLESNNIRDLPRQLFHCQELRLLHLVSIL